MFYFQFINALLVDGVTAITENFILFELTADGLNSQKVYTLTLLIAHTNKLTVPRTFYDVRL